ncbi:MAG: cupin domain-containing protein [Enterobacteriaceae bacterium]|jgi:mannose-6-phosphate isomerase-like protein (cupin superfamily)|nr:cupin domain-containing protein [Enterobacteriaceae bacterium]
MRKLLIASVTALSCLACAGSAFAADDAFPQVYHKSDFIVKDRDKLGGTGEGIVHCEYAFPRDKATADQAIAEIAWLTLPAGASIGLHKHDKNEDSYVIVSGKGVFIDGDNKETPVTAGDVTIARLGDSHSIKNTGTEPFVLLDIVTTPKK